MNPYCECAERVLGFLERIGIEVQRVDTLQGGFVPGIKIVAGCLQASPVATVSDLLHEAGHIAIVPAAYRSMIEADADESTGRIVDKAQLSTLDLQDPLLIRLLQIGDAEATAWAWAAGKYLDIPETLIIRDSDYDGGGAVQRQMLSMGRHFGVHGLQAAGFCLVRANPYRSAATVYPQLKYWLQK